MELEYTVRLIHLGAPSVTHENWTVTVTCRDDVIRSSLAPTRGMMEEAAAISQIEPDYAGFMLVSDDGEVGVKAHLSAYVQGNIEHMCEVDAEARYAETRDEVKTW